MDKNNYYIIKSGTYEINAKTIKEVCPKELIQAKDYDVVMFTDIHKAHRIRIALEQHYQHETFEVQDITFRVVLP